jgi:small subunit ribosomal protein S6
MVENRIVELGGTLLAVDDWGKRRLAYPIEKQKSGSYVLMHFEASPSIVIELQKWFEIQAQILAQLIIRLEEKPTGLPFRIKDNVSETEEPIAVSSVEEEEDLDLDEDDYEEEDEEDEFEETTSDTAEDEEDVSSKEIV